MLLLFTLLCILIYRYVARCGLIFTRPRWELVDWKNLLLRTGFMFVAAIPVTLLLTPDSLFGFVQARPLLWLLVICLYPFLSALPQEFIYRRFFHARYAPVFGESGVIWASTIAFSFLHIIYLNIPSVALTFIAGGIFAKNYRRTGSLTTVALEHAFYGIIAWTVGLGVFFYSGGR